MMPATHTRYTTSGPGVDGSTGEEFFRFLRYGHILSSLLREFLETGFLDRALDHDLTRSQFCFLKLIAGNSELQVGELARYLGVSPAASSKNLDRLEELGLVVREMSTEDRRAILLSASREGMRLVREYEDLKAAQLAPVIAELGEEKTNELCDLLQEVCLRWLERYPEPETPCMRCAGYFRTDCSIEELQRECALRPRRGVEA